VSGIPSHRNLLRNSDSKLLPQLVTLRAVMDIPSLNPFSLIAAIYKRFTNRADRRAAACAAFRETFCRELRGLYPQPTDWPKGSGIEHQLKKVFPELQRAVATFRPYVPDKDKASFDGAWRNYHCATKRDVDDQCYLHYLNMTTTTLNEFGGETVIPNDGKANFKRNVDRLLSFAQDV
jgi:hypothetical protein